MKFHTSQSAYSLVETLVSISILLIAFVGPLTIGAKALQTSYYAREQMTATFLAQEGIETIVAFRNDAALAAVADGDLSRSWDWAVDGAAGGQNISPCFVGSSEGSGAGCNFHYRTNGSINSKIINDCRSEDCRLYFDDSSGVVGPYVLNSGSASETPYTRVVRLVRDGDVVYISSTVSWEPRAFGGAVTPVTLHSAVYNIYDE